MRASRIGVRLMFRTFWPATLGYRIRLAAGAILAVVGPVIDTVQIWMFKLLIDDVIVPRNLAAFPLLALGYLAIGWAQAVGSFTDQWLADWVGERFVLDLRTRLFDHLQGLAVDFFDRRQLGDTLSRLTGDVEAIERVLVSGVTEAVSYLVQIGLFTAALFYLNWRRVGLAGGRAGVPARRPVLLRARIKDASREQRRWTGSVTAVARSGWATLAAVQRIRPRARDRAVPAGGPGPVHRTAAGHPAAWGVRGIDGAAGGRRRRGGGGVGRVGARSGSDLPGRAPDVRDLLVAALQPGQGRRPAVERRLRGDRWCRADSRTSWPSGRRWPSRHTRARSGAPGANWSSTRSSSAIPGWSGRPFPTSRSSSHPGSGWRWSGRAVPASRPSPSCCCASTTRAGAGSASDRHRSEGSFAGLAAPEHRHRPPGDLGVRRNGPGQHPLGRPDATERQLVEAAVAADAHEFIIGAPRRLRELGSASAAGCCPAANGSDWPSPAR